MRLRTEDSNQVGLMSACLSLGRRSAALTERGRSDNVVGGRERERERPNRFYSSGILAPFKQVLKPGAFQLLVEFLIPGYLLLKWVVKLCYHWEISVCTLPSSRKRVECMCTCGMWYGRGGGGMTAFIDFCVCWLWPSDGGERWVSAAREMYFPVRKES